MAKITSLNQLKKELLRDYHANVKLINKYFKDGNYKELYDTHLSNLTIDYVIALIDGAVD